MGDSSFLVRSFSHPSSASREAREGDPLRALRDSVSFGRFMSEPLDWEKWSSFSHNRNLEEAAKISKPGSVAQMKAYFDDHYKKIAVKKAAASLEKENAAIDIPQDIGFSDSTDANGCDPCFSRHNLDNVTMEETKSVTCESVIEENYGQEEISRQCESIEKDDTLKERLASTSNRKSEVSSLKSLACNRASGILSSIVPTPPVIPTPPLPRRKGDNTNANGKKFAREPLARARSTPASSHTSFKFGSCIGEATINSPCLKKDGNSRVLETPVKMSSDGSTGTSQASTNEVSKLSSAVPQSENKSPLESSSPCESKSHSTISSPFRLRTEERVAKRKEFYEKLEEKVKKEARKVRLQPKPKEEAESDLKKLRHGVVLKPKPVADSNCKTGPPINRMNKVQLTRPRSPKLGRKPTPIMVKDSSSKLPTKPSVRADGSKLVKEKINSFARGYGNSGPKKNAQENASPNIQF